MILAIQRTPVHGGSQYLFIPYMLLTYCGVFNNNYFLFFEISGYFFATNLNPTWGWLLCCLNGDGDNGRMELLFQRTQAIAMLAWIALPREYVPPSPARPLTTTSRFLTFSLLTVAPLMTLLPTMMATSMPLPPPI